MGIICKGKTFWGVGIDADIIRASIEALIVAVNKIEEIEMCIRDRNQRHQRRDLKETLP